MKNFVISFLATAFIAAILQIFLPWWSIALAAFGVGLLVQQKPGISFLAGFIAVFALWAGYAYMLSSANNHLLAGKVAELTKIISGGTVMGLVLVSGVIGGLVSGFAALSGRLAGSLVRPTS